MKKKTLQKNDLKVINNTVKTMPLSQAEKNSRIQKIFFEIPPIWPQASSSRGSMLK